MFSTLGIAIFLLFRDVTLEPADDLMPKRPVIAWDDNNGFKKLLELGSRLPGAVRMDLQDAELVELDRLMAGDPFTAEDYREVLRHEFRLLWNFLLDGGTVPGDAGRGIRRYFFQKNRTLNLLARESRADLALAITAPYDSIAELAHERLERWERLRVWRNSNATGEMMVAGSISGDTVMESLARSRLAVHRALRVVIALHRYQLARGSLPATLEALAPAFLPAIPMDPFDFKPLRWDASKRAVYSIGSDRKEQSPDFAHRDKSGWWLLVSSESKAPGARFRIRADGPDFPPGTTPPVKPGPKAKPAPAKP